MKQELPYKNPTWGFSGSPVIVDDLVILNVGAAGVALNKAGVRLSGKAPMSRRVMPAQCRLKEKEKNMWRCSVPNAGCD